MHRRSLWAVACLLLLVFAPALAEPRAWSKDGIFSLIPPAGWTVEKPARNKLDFTLGNATLEVACESQAVPIKDASFKEKVRDSVDQRFKVLSQADTILSGMNAIQCELEGTGDLKDYMGRFVVMTDTNRTWFITYSAPSASAPDAFGAVEEALKTLQLK